MADEHNEKPGQARAEAAAMALQIQGVLAEVESASSGANDKTRGRLSGLVSKLARAQVELTSDDKTIDLSSIEALIGSGEAAAQDAFQEENITTFDGETLSAASASARATAERVGDDLYNNHAFDSSMHFKSKEDEDDYNKTTAENAAAAQTELNKHTAQGNYNATRIDEGQMVNAATYGADQSAQWQKDWADLRAQDKALRAQLPAGQATDDYDVKLRAEVKQYLMKRKGLSEAQCDAELAAAKDPLDVMENHLKDSKDVTTDISEAKQFVLAAKTEDLASNENPTEIASPAAVPTVQASAAPSDIMAKLTASSNLVAADPASQPATPPADPADLMAKLTSTANLTVADVADASSGHGITGQLSGPSRSGPTPA